MGNAYSTITHVIYQTINYLINQSVDHDSHAIDFSRLTKLESSEQEKSRLYFELSSNQSIDRSVDEPDTESIDQSIEQTSSHSFEHDKKQQPNNQSFNQINPLILRHLICLQLAVNAHDQSIDPSSEQSDRFQIERSINQSINQSIIDHDIEEFKQALNTLPKDLHRSINQSIKQPSQRPEWFDRYSVHYNETITQFSDSACDQTISQSTNQAISQSIKPIQHIFLMAMCVMMARQSINQSIKLKPSIDQSVDLLSIIAYDYDNLPASMIETNASSINQSTKQSINHIADNQSNNPIFYLWKSLMIDQSICYRAPSYLTLDLSHQSLSQSINQSINQSTSALVDFARGEVCWSIPSPRVIAYIISLSDCLIDCFAGFGYWAMLFHRAGARSVFAIDDLSEPRNQPNNQIGDPCFCYPVIDSSSVSMPEIIAENQPSLTPATSPVASLDNRTGTFENHSLFFSWVRPEHKEVMKQCIQSATTAPYIFLVAEGSINESDQSINQSHIQSNNQTNNQTINQLDRSVNKVSATAFLDDSDLDPRVWQRVMDTPPMARWPGNYDSLFVWKRIG